VDHRLDQRAKHIFENALDLDSHEFMPTHLYPEYFGDIGRQIMEIFDTFVHSVEDDVPRDNDLTRPEVSADIVEIDPLTIGKLKGPSAPGAIDMRRRVEVLDAMGIERQLVFPSFGFIGLLIASLNDQAFRSLFALEKPQNQQQVGLEAVRAHNDWALSLRDISGRQCHVSIVPTFDRDGMMGEARHVIEGGAGAIWIPMNAPPLNTSPANEALEPFWSLVEEYDIPVVVHFNADPFLDVSWRDAPQFDRQTDSVLPHNTYFMTTQSFAAENFLASLVIGGVFERHPRLRFGVIECGAQWLGPLVERMEMLWDYFPRNKKLPKRPTEYVAEQVRVTPFFFEPVDVFYDRYPQLADVYCFSTDYPHSEGGIDAMSTFYASLEPIGTEVVQKFFRRNAELILPV
jgi:predicted TIM-barrel fold metal-dependent hydrolase